MVQGVQLLKSSGFIAYLLGSDSYSDFLAGLNKTSAELDARLPNASVSDMKALFSSHAVTWQKADQFPVAYSELAEVVFLGQQAEAANFERKIIPHDESTMVDRNGFHDDVSRYCSEQSGNVSDKKKKWPDFLTGWCRSVVTDSPIGTQPRLLEHYNTNETAKKEVALYQRGPDSQYQGLANMPWWLKRATKVYVNLPQDHRVDELEPNDRLMYQRNGDYQETDLFCYQVKNKVREIALEIIQNTTALISLNASFSFRVPDATQDQVQTAMAALDELFGQSGLPWCQNYELNTASFPSDESDETNQSEDRERRGKISGIVIGSIAACIILCCCFKAYNRSQARRAEEWNTHTRGAVRGDIEMATRR